MWSPWYLSTKIMQILTLWYKCKQRIWFHCFVVFFSLIEEIYQSTSHPAWMKQLKSSIYTFDFTRQMVQKTRTYSSSVERQVYFFHPLMASPSQTWKHVPKEYVCLVYWENIAAQERYCMSVSKYLQKGSDLSTMSHHKYRHKHQKCKPTVFIFSAVSTVPSKPRKCFSLTTPPGF